MSATQTRYDVAAIPNDLKVLDRWVVFQIVRQDGKTRKLPLIPGKAGRHPAKADDPKTWRSFDEALRDAEVRGLFLAFVFDPEIPFFFIDADDAVTDGAIRPDVAVVVDTLDTYTEWSQSGTGLHVIGHGAFPPNPTRRAAPSGAKALELYPRRGGRFCIFTGDVIEGHEAIAERSHELAVLFPPRATKTLNGNSEHQPTGMLTDDEASAVVAWASEHWNDGRRHHMALYLSGELARQGVSREQAAGIIERCAADDSDPAAKSSACHDTYDDREAGLSTSGWHGLRDACGLTDDELAPLEKTLSAFWRRNQKSEEDAEEPSGTDDAHLTDLGNAKKLVSRHGHELRYSHNRGAWFIWDGRRWKLDDSGEIERRAKETVLSWFADAGEIPSNKDRKKLALHAMKCEAAARLKAMVDLARSEEGIPVSMDELDRDPWLLTVLNGTLDLRTGELRPHDQCDLITRLVPVSYDPLAECPTFFAFLDQIMQGKAELIEFLQRAIGYSLTGITSERCMFLCWGGGKNGKSTLLDTLLDLLSDVASRTNTDALMAARHERIPNDVAALKGMRFVYASEGEEGRRLAEARVKDLTGGDTISARFMRGEWFDFRPEFKLWFGTNHRPNIRGTDDAIWDRIRLIPFRRRFEPAEQDKQLKTKLLAEAPGILTWAVAGCLAWQRDGLQEPEEVLQATREYRSAEDVMGSFLSDRCEFYESASVTKKALYAAYKQWCDDNGEKSVTQKAFGMRLADLGLDEATYGTGNKRERVWIGIALLVEETHNE